MAGFSFYDWVLQTAIAEEVELRQLGDGSKVQLAGGPQVLASSARAMLHWCKIVERITLERYAEGASVYAGFERLSRVKPVLRRYQRLAGAVDRLVIFAEHDEPLALDAQQVDVSGSPLAREWFLVISCPSYSTLLAAKDLDGFGPNGPLFGRRFVAVTVRERSFIKRAAARLERHVSEA
jgi:DICT domain-containing protein